MAHEIEVQGSTVDDAVAAAAAELGVDVGEVEYEVLDEGARKRFGLGTERPASIRARISGGADVDEAKAHAHEVLEIEPDVDASTPATSVEGDAEESDQDATPTDTEAVVEAESPQTRGADWETPSDIDDAELDRIADVALEVVREILKSFGAGDVEIEEYEGDEGEIILDVVGADLAVLIGRHGRTLDSLQSLVSTIVNRKLGFRYPVIVDIEGYRHRRRQKVESIALSAAERAVRQNTAVRLRPMVAGERRAVHMALRGNAAVITESEGQEPNRLVVIKPAR